MKHTKQIPPQFIVRIAIKNDAGAVVGEREFITYNGLLAVAHEIGLDAIHTSIEEMPSEANGQTAVCDPARATREQASKLLDALSAEEQKRGGRDVPQAAE